MKNTLNRNAACWAVGVVQMKAIKIPCEHDLWGKWDSLKKKERGFLDTKSRIIVMPYKNIFDLESVVDVFQHGRNLYIKENST